MGHYKPNVRDLEFNLFEVLELEKTLAGGEFGDLDGDTVRDMLGEAARLAQGPLAEPFTEGDRNPPTFDPRTHGVTLPDGFKAAVRAWMDAGWSRVGLEEAIGGVRTPSTVACAINEFLFTLLIASTKSAYTLSVALANFTGGSDGIIYNAIALVSFVAFAPILLLVILIQNHLSRGLTMGAVKG